MSDGRVVGVVGESAAVSEALAGADLAVRTGAVSDVLAAGVDAVVAGGEAALLAVARAAPEVPVLPIEAGRGVRSVPASEAGAAVRRLAGGDPATETHPVFSVSVGGHTTARALMDAMLVTAEAAKISEYGVEAGGERLATMRADGVVVAAPAGSSGYARAADGPVMPPETDALALVPVAPFATDADHWVVPSGRVELAVQRDETTVHLLADDRVVGPVDPHEPVVVEPTASVRLAVVPESRSPFG